MTGFAQLIDWKTSRLDEVEKLNDEWRERFPTMGPSRILVCADKDNAGSYMTMVEFSFFEEAMENSNDPATSEFAEKMGALCEGPPIFHNLDIVRVENRSRTADGPQNPRPLLFEVTQCAAAGWLTGQEHRPMQRGRLVGALAVVSGRQGVRSR